MQVLPKKFSIIEARRVTTYSPVLVLDTKIIVVFSIAGSRGNLRKVSLICLTLSPRYATFFQEYAGSLSQQIRQNHSTFFTISR